MIVKQVDLETVDTKPYKTTVSATKITSIFDDLENEAVDFIKGADAIVGCIAWITNPTILKEMKDISSSIIVQKEDFLRPDGADGDWHTMLHNLYSGMKPLDWQMENIYPDKARGDR